MSKEELEAVRGRVLSSLRVGRQSPQYKKGKQLLDEFITLLLQD